MLHINHKLALLLYYVLISFLITSCSQSDQKMQWALENNGQNINGSIGIKGIDIEYMNTEPSTKATIAIIDSGFINSPYLKEQIFINVGEIKDDGIDNDGNGFIDDWCGWDFSLGKCIEYTSITNSHGTEIAHIIASNSDQYIGVTSNAKLINIKIDEEDISPEILVQAINYVESLGANIVNLSLSIPNDSDLLYTTIKNSKMLFVCAAGNDHKQTCTLPARYELENVISVGGITNKGTISAFSNFGNDIELGAPGEDILVIDINLNAHFSSGSSYATAFVSGIACELVSLSSFKLTAPQIKELLLKSAKTEITLNGYIQNARIVSMEKALALLVQEQKNNTNDS